MPLTPKQINIVKLIRRSRPGDDGWYRVSGIVWPIVDGVLPDDLVETKPAEEGGFLRFTDRGQAVADYL